VTIRSWPEGAVVEAKRLDESVIESVRWLPDGNAMLAGTLAGQIRLWPLGGGPVDFAETHPEAVLGLALLPDGKRLVSSDALGNLWLWDIGGRKRLEAAWPPADKSVDIVALSHSGKKVLTAGNSGIVYVYDLDAPGEPVRIDLDSRQIDGAAWSADDSLIAAVDTEGNLKVWSLTDGKMLVSVRIYLAGRPASDDDAGQASHLRRMLWLPGRPAVAIASSAGEVVIVTIDTTAWLDRARSVFGLGAAAQSAPAE
jgi:WD40 repeat protein